ncbi:MAG: CYTH domain-containing protein [Thermoplasmata archaeon]
MRVVDGRDAGTLIHYRRDDMPDPKPSRVSLLSVADPSPLNDILSGALGVLVEVRKRRRVFRWGEVQVHLDRVDTLGTFVEFERMVDSREEEARAEAEFAELRVSLGISDEDLEAGSYSDLVRKEDPQAD